MWATGRITRARQERTQILVPEIVAGEAYTKLRHDRRVSPRRDAGVALLVFGLLQSDSRLFRTLGMPNEAYQRSQKLLKRYRDQNFTYVDAIVFLTADDESTVEEVLTVDDQDFQTYSFERSIDVNSPLSRP